MITLAFIPNLWRAFTSAFRRGPVEGRFSAYRVGPVRHPNIEPWMEEAFADLVHAGQNGGPFALVPCVVRGHPTAAIVLVERQGSKGSWKPLFVAVTAGMAITFPTPGHPHARTHE